MAKYEYQEQIAEWLKSDIKIVCQLPRCFGKKYAFDMYQRAKRRLIQMDKKRKNK
jgi:hypothetical protein